MKAIETIDVQMSDAEYKCNKCNTNNIITDEDLTIMCLYEYTDVQCSKCKEEYYMRLKKMRQ